MKIAVPGGNGFVGGVLSRRLLEQGHSVEVWTRQKSKFENLQNFKVRNLSQHIQVPLISSDTDAVVYLSGISAPDAIDRTREMFHVNVFLATQIFKKFTSSNNEVFIYASSSHVSTLLSGELLANLNENEAIRLYAISKLSAETILSQINVEIQKNLVLLRLDNCFGAPDLECGSDTPGAINDFCRQGIENGVIKLRSDGSAKRTFLPINTCVDMIIDGLSGFGDEESIAASQRSSTELTLRQAAELSSYFCQELTGMETLIEIQGKVIERNEASLRLLLGTLSNEFVSALKQLVEHYSKNND